MDKFYFSCAAFVTLLIGQASAFQGSTSIVGDPVKGSTITVQCSWSLAVDESLLQLSIGTPPINNDANIYYYTIFTGNSPSPIRGNQYHDRLSVVGMNISSGSVSMNISGLQCSDEQNYTCQFSYSKSNQMTRSLDPKMLNVRVLPEAPDLRITPSNASLGVMELTNISVTCTANVGRPGQGDFQWMIYRNGVPETVPSGDQRNGTLKDAPLSQDDRCTKRMEQTFSIQVTRAYQNLSVACFVRNPEYIAATVPGRCQDKADLCSVTDPITVFYGVAENSTNVKQEPTDNIYQGQSVTLTCQAEGVPPPSYMWVKIEDVNNTVVGNESQLNLPDRVVTGDGGETYNCTASNTVFGNSFSVTKGRTFIVNQTTTTSTTTTTTTTTTATTTAVGENSGSPQPQNKTDDDNSTIIIIIVVVVVGVLLIIAIIIGIVCWRRRRSRKGSDAQHVIKRMEHGAIEKPYNNRTNPSYQSSQPDLVADKKLHALSLDSVAKSSLSGSIPSFNEKKEDGLVYADLTYENIPRSRKPMAVSDSSSEFSDVQMPQV